MVRMSWFGFLASRKEKCVTVALDMVCDGRYRVIVAKPLLVPRKLCTRVVRGP